MHRFDRGDYWRAERLMPTITFTGTPLIPYVITEPVGSDWEREYARVLRDAEHQGRTRRGLGLGLHRFASLRHAIGGAMIRSGERIAGVKPSEPACGPVGDLHGAH